MFLALNPLLRPSLSDPVEVALPGFVYYIGFIFLIQVCVCYSLWN